MLRILDASVKVMGTLRNNSNVTLEDIESLINHKPPLSDRLYEHVSKVLGNEFIVESQEDIRAWNTSKISE